MVFYSDEYEAMDSRLRGNDDSWAVHPIALARAASKIDILAFVLYLFHCRSGQSRPGSRIEQTPHTPSTF
jgi:hypothetical protein